MEEKQLEPLNAYKLMEAPYMADKLKENDYNLVIFLIIYINIDCSNPLLKSSICESCSFTNLIF